MGKVVAKVVLASVTGLAEDAVNHDWTFRWDGPVGPTDAELGELATVITNAYNNVNAGAAQTPVSFISPEISRAAGSGQIRLYRHDNIQSGAGSPQLVVPFTPGPSDNQQGLPGEVACVISVNADLSDVQVEVGNTRPQSRRKGRVYFGPLGTSSLEHGTNVAQVQRPKSTLRSCLRQMTSDLADDAAQVMNLNAGLFMSVYSAADIAIRSVVNVSTDDAFDTQRRRGAAATARENLAIPGLP